MGTTANAEPLFTGRFAELYAKFQPLDPYHSAESTAIVSTMLASSLGCVAPSLAISCAVEFHGA
jgi:hypothetical protein